MSMQFQEEVTGRAVIQGGRESQASGAGLEQSLDLVYSLMSYRPFVPERK